MKTNTHFLRSKIAFVGLLSVQIVSAQCPAITCPGNQTVNNTPGTCGAVVTYVTPVGVNPCGVGQTRTFIYTGAVQTFTVPAGVTSINIAAKGARGGTSGNDNAQCGQRGGLGGSASGALTVVPGQVLNIYVGGRGQAGNVGGYNGGGAACPDVNTCSRGGGASDVRQGGNALSDRKIVAAGGGGVEYSACNGNGGDGGGLSGIGGNEGGFGGRNGGGAIQGVGGVSGVGAYNGSPGLLGVGGASGNHPQGHGGSGGGGYYGGGGSAEDGHGGGGSSYIGGVLNGVTTSGVNTLDGEVIITYPGGVPTTNQTVGLASGSLFPVGTTTNTFQVSDGLGNTAVCSFTVTVRDNQVPAIICPSNITVNNALGTCGAVVTFNAPVGTDNCSATTALTVGLPSGSIFPIGVTTESYRVTDAAGNSTLCSFTVTVVDSELPTISCLGNITVCNPIVTGIAPTNTSDNCAGSTVGYTLTGATIGNGFTDASGTTFNVGTTSVMYTITDASGNTNNCVFNVLVNLSYNTNKTAVMCQGDSILLGGSYQTTAATYLDTLLSALGCDSILHTALTVNLNPVVVLSAFANDTICEGDAAVALPNATPAGGTFSGAGVVGGNFNPATAGLGNHYVVYSSTNANGCTGIDSTLIAVVLCAGINDGFNDSRIIVYPNPTSGILTINLGSISKSIEVSVMELNGALVKSEKYSNSKNVRMDISNLSNGMYFVTVKSDNELKQVKIVKN